MKDAGFAALVFIGYAVILTLVLCLPFMLLWNWIMPDIFGLDKINFFQAIGLLLISNLLFKSSSVQKKN